MTTLALVYGFQQTVPRIPTCRVFRASPQSAASRRLPHEDAGVRQLIRQILSVVDRRCRRRRTQRSLANNGRSFELDAVAFRILQIDRRALAFGTIAQHLRTAGDALPGKMFRNCHRVRRARPVGTGDRGWPRRCLMCRGLAPARRPARCRSMPGRREAAPVSLAAFRKSDLTHGGRTARALRDLLRAVRRGRFQQC